MHIKQEYLHPAALIDMGDCLHKHAKQLAQTHSSHREGVGRRCCEVDAQIHGLAAGADGGAGRENKLIHCDVAGVYGQRGGQERLNRRGKRVAS